MNGQFPPGLESPLLYMAAVGLLLLGVLLALEWLWRIVWSFFERPSPFRTPSTAVRVTLIILLVGGLVRAGPRLWLFMRWPQLTPAGREGIAELSAYMEITGVLLFSIAWLFAQLGEPMISHQLTKQPLPLHLWPTVDQLRRPAKIGLGVFAIAFALTYLR